MTGRGRDGETNRGDRDEEKIATENCDEQRERERERGGGGERREGGDREIEGARQADRQTKRETNK